MNTQGTVAIVTGAASGIGKSVAERYAPVIVNHLSVYRR